MFQNGPTEIEKVRSTPQPPWTFVADIDPVFYLFLGIYSAAHIGFILKLDGEGGMCPSIFGDNVG